MAAHGVTPLSVQIAGRQRPGPETPEVTTTDDGPHKREMTALTTTDDGPHKREMTHEAEIEICSYNRYEKK